MIGSAHELNEWSPYKQLGISNLTQVSRANLKRRVLSNQIVKLHLWNGYQNQVSGSSQILK